MCYLQINLMDRLGTKSVLLRLGTPRGRGQYWRGRGGMRGGSRYSNGYSGDGMENYEMNQSYRSPRGAIGYRGARGFTRGYRGQGGDFRGKVS